MQDPNVPGGGPPPPPPPDRGAAAAAVPKAGVSTSTYAAFNGGGLGGSVSNGGSMAGAGGSSSTTGATSQDGGHQQQQKSSSANDSSDRKEQDFYDVLQVDKAATPDVIKKSYRKLVIKWHPDKHPADRETADEKIRMINNAYETLSNPAKKQAYDEQMAALERKKNGIQLPTSSIAPRMAIPKEFMLCPLASGCSQKFVRYQGSNLFVQSREDDSKCEFMPFFEKTRFNLYWLPEVNNMCRIRPAATAQVGSAGGMNITFGELKEGESELHLSAAAAGNQAQPNSSQINFIAVPSPTMTNAFRFEAAYFPGAYLAFKEPNHLRVITQIDDAAKTSIDFSLVKYDTMFKYVTMEEVLVPSMIELSSSGSGAVDSNGYVSLDRLRSHESVILYFRNILGTQPWDAEDFETYFDAHWQQWYYSGGKVKLRTRDEQLAHSLRKAKKGTDLAAPIAEADPKALEKLHLETVERVLMVLWRDNSGASIQYAVDKMTAQKKLLQAVPGIIEASSVDSLGLHRLVTLDLLVNSIEDRSLHALKLELRKHFAQLFARKAEEVVFGSRTTSGASTTEQVLGTQEAEVARKVWRISTIEELEVVLTLPLDVKSVDPLLAADASHVQDGLEGGPISPLIADKLLDNSSTEKLKALLKIARNLEMPMFSQTLARTLLFAKLPKETLSQKKRDILLCVADLPGLAEGAVIELGKAELHKDDFAEVLGCKNIASAIDRSAEDVHKTITQEISPYLTPALDALTALGLACARSIKVAAACLLDVLKASPMHIKSLNVKQDELAQFFFVVAKAYQLYRERADEEGLEAGPLRKQVLNVADLVLQKAKIEESGELSTGSLVKLLFSSASVVTDVAFDDIPLSAFRFFESANEDLPSRISGMPLSQLLCYTEGLLCKSINFQMRLMFAGEFAQLIAFWEQMLLSPSSSSLDAKERERRKREANGPIQGTTISSRNGTIKIIPGKVIPGVKKDKKEDEEVEDEVTKKRLEMERRQNQLSLKQLVSLGRVVGDFIREDHQGEQEERDAAILGGGNLSDNEGGEDDQGLGRSTSAKVSAVPDEAYESYKSFWDALTTRVLRRLSRKNLDLLTRVETIDFLQSALQPWPVTCREKLERRVQQLNQPGGGGSSSSYDRGDRSARNRDGDDDVDEKDTLVRPRDHTSGRSDGPLRIGGGRGGYNYSSRGGYGYGGSNYGRRGDRDRETKDRDRETKDRERDRETKDRERDRETKDREREREREKQDRESTATPANASIRGNREDRHAERDRARERDRTDRDEAGRDRERDRERERGRARDRERARAEEALSSKGVDVLNSLPQAGQNAPAQEDHEVDMDLEEVDMDVEREETRDRERRGRDRERARRREKEELPEETHKNFCDRRGHDETELAVQDEDVELLEEPPRKKRRDRDRERDRERDRGRRRDE
ncbi:unnamed protein product [Amoebophrya sp. A25]|nr:unnamed protein product [Amoebophrya sp. A25]|eukprot:GSA25T00024238001.1